MTTPKTWPNCSRIITNYQTPMKALPPPKPIKVLRTLWRNSHSYILVCLKNKMGLTRCLRKKSFDFQVLHGTHQQSFLCLFMYPVLLLSFFLQMFSSTYLLMSCAWKKRLIGGCALGLGCCYSDLYMCNFSSK